MMKVIHKKCAGLDVHAAFVTVCAREVRRGKVTIDEARFETSTPGLLNLADWLTQHGVSHVVMEATGVYWKPVWHILAPSFQLTLANAHDAKNLPGRKSDTSDARWLAELLAHGLVRASFVPGEPIQELRDLTRTRQQLQRQMVQHENRIAKVLEDANIKLTGVVSNLLGRTGRRILAGLIAGETNADRLAKLADPRIKATPAELAAALTGRFTKHHAFLVREHLTMIDTLAERIGVFEAEIAAVLAPFRGIVERMTHIPGVQARAAATILAEIGIDMSVFPTSGHLLSWARMVPRLDESGGKKRSSRVKRGGAWLKPTLVQCAWAAARTKETYLSRQFAAIASRRGVKKAAIAVAGSILTAVYHMIRDDAPYRPPQPRPLDAAARTKKARRLIQQLRTLGVEARVSALA